MLTTWFRRIPKPFDLDLEGITRLEAIRRLAKDAYALGVPVAMTSPVRA
jgi:hypothetical protein